MQRTKKLLGKMGCSAYGLQPSGGKAFDSTNTGTIRKAPRLKKAPPPEGGTPYANLPIVCRGVRSFFFPGFPGRLYFATFLVCCHLSSFAAEILKWDDPNQQGAVKAFIICAAGPLPAPTIRKVTVRTNELDLAYLLKNAPTGRYAIYGMSVSTNDIPSEKSNAMVVYWADGKIVEETALPAALPATMAGCEKLAYSHEGNGVLYQTGHNSARIFTATECQSVGAGEICKVALNLRQLRKPKGEITVHVWGNYKKRPAALLSSSIGTIGAAQITDGWYEVPIKFKALPGETYWVGYSFPKSDPENGVIWLGGGPGARCYSADGITWIYSTNEGLNVRLYN